MTPQKDVRWIQRFNNFANQDGSTLYGSRDVFRLAFKRGLVDNGEFWMDMITSRTLTTHTYNQDTAEKIVKDVLAKYFGEFQKLYTKLTDLQKQIPL